jgi:hypothetical protein
MCVTIDGNLAIILALYGKDECCISDINQIADSLIMDIENVNIVLNRVTIYDFINSRSSCFSYDSDTAMIKKINTHYEFPQETIDYYIRGLSKEIREKVRETYCL